MRRVMVAKVPVILYFPDQMRGVTSEVLNGEYEFGYFGEDLTILDIGANVGAFTIWANLRWPKSTIHAYEPHPETFQILISNVEDLRNVACHNLAVYPSQKGSESLWSQGAGDAHAGLVRHVSRTLKDPAQGNIIEVPILHPQKLPKADIIKMDIEGGEVQILREMDIQDVSLILLEYHDVESRDTIKQLLRDAFTLEYEDSVIWDSLLPSPVYSENMKGDYIGKLFFANKRYNRLRKITRPMPR